MNNKFYKNFRLGYGIDEMDPPLAPCGLTTTVEAYVSLKVTSRSTFTTTANSFTAPFSSGYICEKESKIFYIFKCNIAIKKALQEMAVF